MKKKKLNSQQLGLLSSAFIKSLFVLPKKRELLVGETSRKDLSVDLYFSDEYHEKLDLDIRSKYYNGEFSKSNSEKEWNDLMIAINTAEITMDDTSNFSPHPMSINNEDEDKDNIYVNEQELSIIFQGLRPQKETLIFMSLKELTKDLQKVYVGHKIDFDYGGNLHISRLIDKNSFFSSNLDLIPALKLIKWYDLEIGSLDIKSKIESEKMFVSFYLTN